jgi:hypothetical protein
MKYILILMIGVSSGNPLPSLSTAEFDDEPACIAARTQTLRMIEAAKVGANAIVGGICAPKGSAKTKRQGVVLGSLRLKREHPRFHDGEAISCVLQRMPDLPHGAG